MALKLSGVCRVEVRQGHCIVCGFDRLIEGFEGAVGFESGRSKRDTGRCGGATSELLLEILKAPIDIEGQAAGDNFESFALALPLDITILLNNANGEPAEDANGKKRRDGEVKRKPSPMCPDHGGLILSARGHDAVSVLSRTRQD